MVPGFEIQSDRRHAVERIRHGLLGKGLLAQPIDRSLFLEAAGTFWQNQV